MREAVINRSLNLIEKRNPTYSDEKMEILRYGLEGLYIFITKSIVIFSIAYFLGIFKELLIFMLIYNLIRLFSFGIHATSSRACLIASAATFILATYICKNFVIPINVRLIFGIMATIYVFIYSPADTEKRPIVSPKRRTIYKTISTVIAITMVICSMVITNTFIANAFILSLLIQCAMISPVTYRLTNQQYDNYKYYQMV